MTRGGGLRTALLFLLLAFPAGLFFASAVPLGQVADELAHVLRADSVLHGELIGVRGHVPRPDGTLRPSEGVMAEPELLASVATPIQPRNLGPQLVDPAKLRASEALRFAGALHFQEVGTIASYFPVFYLPGAAAIGFAHVVGAHPNAAFRAARLANLLAACLLGAAAIAITARGRLLLLTVLLLPTSLSLMASASQDGLILATTALAVACATRLEAARGLGRNPFFWALAGLAAAICIVKPPYAGLLLLLFLPRGARALPAAVAAMIGVAAVVWVVLAVHRCGAPIYRGVMEAGPLWTGPRPATFEGTDMGAQLHVLLARPWRLVSVPADALLHQGYVFREVVGVLGWLNLMVPRPLVVVWLVALACATLAPALLRRTRPDRRRLRDAALVLAGLAGSVELIYLSQYLSFTDVGARFVEGVQGRYFLPLLPLLAVALHPREDAVRPAARAAVLAATIAAGCATLFWMPPAIIRFYWFG